MYLYIVFFFHPQLQNNNNNNKKKAKGTLLHLLFIHHCKGPRLIGIYLPEVWVNYVDPEQNAEWS